MAQKRLKTLLRYEPKTGEFYWNVPKKTRYGITKPGDRAGSTLQNGYRIIGLDKQRLLSHRLAWLYVHGEWPGGFIDHIDGNRANNCISNLRIASRSQNSWNTRKTWGKSGIRGVTFNRNEKRWVANINIGGVRRFLGYFDDPGSAKIAYERAAREAQGAFYPR